MAEQKVNKKLLIVCGVLLVVGGVFFLMPFGKSNSNKDSGQGTVTTPNSNKQEIANNIVNVPESPLVDIPNSQFSNVDLSKYSNTSYALSTKEVVNSKNSGIYNTYKDNKDYIDNPYYQKYSFAKETGEVDVDIKDFPKSYYGSLATQKDFTSEFPTGSSNNSTQNTDSEKPTETTNPTETTKPTETTEKTE